MTAVAEERDLYLEQLDRWDLHGVLDANGVVDALVPDPELAQLMRDGVPPAPMLLEGWLYESELHWLYADAEAGKTWVALILACEVLKQGKRVVWFDEELGKQSIARRLLTLGADADLIEGNFAYFDFPSLTTKDADRHRDSLKAMKPALVVYDTATDMLTAAGLDENSGGEVTTWVKAFPEQARQLGITQIVCDHTAKEGRTAVGSRAKRAKAKVQYYLQAQERWDQDTVGRLRVQLTKNTPGNPLPQERDYLIGGDGHGGFVWELAETHATADRDGRKEGKRDACRAQIQSALREHGPLSQTQLRERIDHGDKIVLEVLAGMVAEPLASGVEVESQGNKKMYSWVGITAMAAEGASDEAPPTTS
jgi:KaiC/GvpD/RAD55 family RecA-like ATPase